MSSSSGNWLGVSDIYVCGCLRSLRAHEALGWGELFAGRLYKIGAFICPSLGRRSVLWIS